MDVWSSGVTLFNLISSDYPFDGDSLMKLFENITNLPVNWPTNVEISENLHRFLNGILDKNPETRWNSTGTNSYNVRIEQILFSNTCQ